MKTITIFLIHFLLLTTIFGQQVIPNYFELRGSITGQDSGYLHLAYVSKNAKYINDSAQIRNGKFFFSGYIDNPVAAVIYGKVKSRGTGDLNFTEIFLEAGDLTITLAFDDFKHAIISGSNSQKEIDRLRFSNHFYKEVESLERKYTIARDSLRKDRDNKSLADSVDATREKLTPYYKIINENKLMFIATHPSSYVSAYFLGSFTSRITLDSVKMFYATFSPPVKNSYYGSIIESTIRSIEGGMPGSLAKDFSARDINGIQLRLSSFRGKYVLLDFWASWCIPCRQNNPHLIELYNKYHSQGLEIIGIANDDTRVEAWKKAIDEDKIGIWHQVLQGIGSKEDIGKKFGITPIPAKILLDTKGVILLRYEANEDLLLDNKLAEIFGN